MFDLTLLEDSDESVINKLKSFNALNCKASTFDYVDIYARKVIVQLITKHLDDDNHYYASAILNTMRLLSRDDKNIEYIFEQNVAEYILRWAGLLTTSDLRLETENLTVRKDALMCLINGLYQSSNMRKFFNHDSQVALKMYLVDLLDLQIKQTLDAPFYDLQSYILKILFNIIAIQKNCRDIWLQANYYDVLLKLIQQKLSEEHLNGIMKVFIILLSSSKDNEQNLENDELVLILNRILTASSVGTNIVENSVCLLSCLPVRPNFLCPVINQHMDVHINTRCDGMDMVPIQIIVDKMNRKIENNDTETIGAYLTVLLNYSVACKEIRRYIRLQILPPLREVDVTRSPSDGDTLRNKLVRLMMGTDISRRLAGELMFSLCNNSVSRMIKYTGLGHSAGLFANYGLLGQINTPESHENSEDSDTEDYNSVEPQVNPVAGYIRPQDGISPFEGMSEEQKEYEAMKLMELMNKMMNSGVIKPGTVGEDGKPKAVSHVLELIKDVPESHNNEGDSE